MAIQSDEVAIRAGMPEYQGTARANLAWVFWRTGDPGEGKKKALDSLDQWQKIPATHASCSFKWTALLPLIAIATLEGQLEQAIEYDRALLDPVQMRFPDPLKEALNKAIVCWENTKTEEAVVQFNRSVEVAKEYGYL